MSGFGQFSLSDLQRIEILLLVFLNKLMKFGKVVARGSQLESLELVVTISEKILCFSIRRWIESMFPVVDLILSLYKLLLLLLVQVKHAEAHVVPELGVEFQ